MPCSNCQCPFHIIRNEDGPFSPAEMSCLLDGAVQHAEIDDGEVMFMQGQPSTCLYAVTEGMVKICTHSSDGRERIVGVSCPDRLLVGLQSISGDRYAYTAIAATKVRACRINHRTLLARIESHPDVAMRVIRALNAQLAHSRALMDVLNHKSASAKIAALILLMTPRTDHGTPDFQLHFSRLEIASLLGLSEETVCRLMANMRRAGVIHAPRGKIEVRDWDFLFAIAESGTPVTAGGVH